MRILLTGDSITDMERMRNADFTSAGYGHGYSFFIEGELASKFPMKYEVINRGVSGNRVVDLYARIRKDCVNLKPDVISVLIGINDIWHEVFDGNGVEIERYKQVYEMFIEYCYKILPQVKLMLIEPFVLDGQVTHDDFETFNRIRDYAKVVKELAQKYNCVFVPLQNEFDNLLNIAPAEHWLVDGVHPTVAGAKIISDKWLDYFYKYILENKD